MFTLPEDHSAIGIGNCLQHVHPQPVPQPSVTKMFKPWLDRQHSCPWILLQSQGIADPLSWIASPTAGKPGAKKQAYRQLADRSNPLAGRYLSDRTYGVRQQVQPACPVRDAFICSGRCSAEHLLLFDNVITTSADRISVIALARTP